MRSFAENSLSFWSSSRLSRFIIRSPADIRTLSSSRSNGLARKSSAPASTDTADAVEPDTIRQILSGLHTENLRELVLEEIARSPMFIASFRENAMRSLLLPRNKPGGRTPLWMQRLRAGDFLEVTKQYEDFPVILETIRDCLNDRMDFESFETVVSGIESGSIAVHAVQTAVPSPFAASLLFGFIGVFMYEDDRPRAEWHSQLLQVNRSLLDEVLDPSARRALVQPRAGG